MSEEEYIPIGVVHNRIDTLVCFCDERVVNTAIDFDFFLSWKDYFRTSFRCIRSGQRDHLHGTEINFCYIGKKNAIIESCLFLGSLPLIAAYNPIIRQCRSIWNGSFLLGAVQFGTEVFFAPRTRHLARFR